MNFNKMAIRVILPFLVLLAIGAVIIVRGSGSDKQYTTFTVRQGPLDIKVLEGGNVEALESQEVKSQVKGYQGVKILSIVEEGMYITAEDVKNKKVLVELDSSELVEKLTTSQISFKGTEASLTEALKGYEIQINKSESDIYASELETKFARLEMEKYLGVEVTEEVISVIGENVAKPEVIVEAAPVVPDEPEESPETNAEEKKPEQSDPGKTPEQPELPEITLEDLRLGHPDINFSAFVQSERLGDGGANQELSNLKSAAALALADLTKAKTDRDGKRRLLEGEHITLQEFETSEIIVDKEEAGKDASEKALQIFINYEFPKMAEKLMSDFIQARRKLARTEQQALSEIAQANARMASAKARYKIEEKRIREYEEQIEVCIMVAERAGLVVYGGSGRNYWNSEPIKEGATIRERQSIITIPDMSTMAVKVNIHESDIKKVKVGLRARIRVDAFPEMKLEGEVTKVAVLPDAENRWMNPDLKVYATTVAIKGVHEWLKPGMSAETEIFIKRLDDAIYIPLQSVVPQKGKLVCFVIENGEPVPRIIETKDITVEYIIVTSGLKVGEKVLIRPPEGSRDDEDAEDEEGETADEGDDVKDAPDTEAASDEKSEDATEEVKPTEPEEDKEEATPPKAVDPKMTKTDVETEAVAVDSD